MSGRPYSFGRQAEFAGSQASHLQPLRTGVRDIHGGCQRPMAKTEVRRLARDQLVESYSGGQADRRAAGLLRLLATAAWLARGNQSGGMIATNRWLRILLRS